MKHQQLHIYNYRNLEDVPVGTVLVDRRTPWGNPFILGKDGTREEVCEKFEQYALERCQQDPKWLEPLIGKSLLCWCAPQRCHAETLLRMANET